MKTKATSECVARKQATFLSWRGFRLYAAYIVCQKLCDDHINNPGVRKSVTWMF